MSRERQSGAAGFELGGAGQVLPGRKGKQCRCRHGGQSKRGCGMGAGAAGAQGKAVPM